MDSPSKRIIPPVPTSSRVQFTHFAHVHYIHPDLSAFSEFSKHWGFVEVKRTPTKIYYRGYGSQPYVYVAEQSADGEKRYVGPTYAVASREELIKASKLPGAGEIINLDGVAPGGGEVVSVKDPSGGTIHVIFGQKLRDFGDAEHSDEMMKDSPLKNFNFPLEKPRKGVFIRLNKKPAMVHKVGHTGYTVPAAMFLKTVDFYLRNFNFIPSDTLHAPNDTELDVAIFMRLDLGKGVFTDHHSLFLLSDPSDDGKESKPHHSSFEVKDFDTQLLGHDWLLERGYEQVWGVGRHILGSQIFDYWKDSSGFVMEHYVDGDVADSTEEYGRHIAGPDSLVVWGPKPPKGFAD